MHPNGEIIRAAICRRNKLIGISHNWKRKTSWCGRRLFGWPIRTEVGTILPSLKLRVVAGGMESQEELRFFQAHQSDEAQGYYFSRPVVAQQLPKLLETGIGETVRQ